MDTSTGVPGTLSQEMEGLKMSEDESKLPWYKQEAQEGLPISDVLGKRPRLIHLKNNDELNGKEITIRHITTSEGEFGAFLIIGAFVDKEAVTIVTGATDIVERLLPLVDSINSGAVIKGKLNKVGRKWLLD